MLRRSPASRRGRSGRPSGRSAARIDEVDAQVAQAVVELVAGDRRIPARLRSAAVEAALQLLRQRGWRALRSRPLTPDSDQRSRIIARHELGERQRVAWPRSARCSSSECSRPPREAPRAGRGSADTARGNSRGACATSRARARRTTCPGGASPRAGAPTAARAKSVELRALEGERRRIGPGRLAGIEQLADALHLVEDLRRPVGERERAPSVHSSSPGSRPRLATGTWLASNRSDCSCDSGGLSRSRQSAAKASRKQSLRWLTPTGS